MNIIEFISKYPDTIISDKNILLNYLSSDTLTGYEIVYVTVKETIS